MQVDGQRLFGILHVNSIRNWRNLSIWNVLRSSLSIEPELVLTLGFSERLAGVCWAASPELFQFLHVFSALLCLLIGYDVFGGLFKFFLDLKAGLILFLLLVIFFAFFFEHLFPHSDLPLQSPYLVLCLKLDGKRYLRKHLNSSEEVILSASLSGAQGPSGQGDGFGYVFLLWQLLDWANALNVVLWHCESFLLCYTVLVKSKCSFLGSRSMLLACFKVIESHWSHPSWAILCQMLNWSKCVNFVVRPTTKASNTHLWWNEHLLDPRQALIVAEVGVSMSGAHHHARVHVLPLTDVIWIRVHRCFLSCHALGMRHQPLRIASCSWVHFKGVKVALWVLCEHVCRATLAKYELQALWSPLKRPCRIHTAHFLLLVVLDLLIYGHCRFQPPRQFGNPYRNPVLLN